MTSYAVTCLWKLYIKIEDKKLLNVLANTTTCKYFKKNMNPLGKNLATHCALIL